MLTRHHFSRATIALTACLTLLLAAASAAHAQGPTFTGTNSLSWGTPRSGAWQSGAPYYAQTAASPVGINWMQATIDGSVVQTCVAGCSGGTLSMNLPTTRFADGEHQVMVSATDNGGASSYLTWTLRVDNTAPAPPANVGIEGGVGWRAQPGLRASWANPAQPLAPLNGVTYRLCPVEADSSDPTQAAAGKARCVQDTLTGDSVLPWEPGPMPTVLPDGLSLPAPGRWTLRVWLRDAAGNQNPDAAAVIGGLGYDPTPPQVAGFLAAGPERSRARDGRGRRRRRPRQRRLNRSPTRRQQRVAITGHAGHAGRPNRACRRRVAAARSLHAARHGAQRRRAATGHRPQHRRIGQVAQASDPARRKDPSRPTGRSGLPRPGQTPPVSVRARPARAGQTWTSDHLARPRELAA